ncbi:MLO-like protein 14 [Platanthera guangdongensis]|uniref:MLO-like protein 14 n=1 Tax=Platanthera guangdongensis TaxID=2320717 RepID=A0ABR2MSV3_9ASPA
MRLFGSCFSSSYSSTPAPKLETQKLKASSNILMLININNSTTLTQESQEKKPSSSPSPPRPPKVGKATHNKTVNKASDRQLVMLVGTKLQHVVALLALEAVEAAAPFSETLLKPRDDLFWFGKPDFLVGIRLFHKGSHIDHRTVRFWATERNNPHLLLAHALSKD